MRLKIAVLPLLVLWAFPSESASGYPNKPFYDCTAEETKMYIEQVTHNVFAPSPITNPDEFSKAYAEAAQKKADAGGDATCATIFTDGTLEDGWKDIVDTLRNLDFNISFSSMDGAILDELLKKAKERITEEANSAFGKIGEDVCGLISSENLKGLLLDGINKKYGMNARNLRLKDFANEITEEQLLAADDDVLLLLSEDKLIDKIGAETKEEMRDIRKDLWNNF